MTIVPADRVLADTIVAVRCREADLVPRVLKVISDLRCDLCNVLLDGLRLFFSLREATYLVICHLLAQCKLEFRLVFLILKSGLEGDNYAIHEEIVKLNGICVLMLLLQITGAERNEVSEVSSVGK